MVLDQRLPARWTRKSLLNIEHSFCCPRQVVRAGVSAVAFGQLADNVCSEFAQALSKNQDQAELLVMTADSKRVFTCLDTKASYVAAAFNLRIPPFVQIIAVQVTPRFVKTEPEKAKKMGVYVADSDSESLNEKGQKTTTNKQSQQSRQSRCPLALPWQVLKKYREKREQKYRPKINEIHEQINKSREKLELAWKGPWQGTTSPEQRYAIWQHGLVSRSLNFEGYSFSTSLRYMITTLNEKTGSKNIVVHDFRTPEGREEAFKWWDARYQRHSRGTAYILHKYGVWEEMFQSYIEGHHSYQRKILLLGVEEIHWSMCKVEEFSY